MAGALVRPLDLFPHRAGSETGGNGVSGFFSRTSPRRRVIRITYCSDDWRQPYRLPDACRADDGGQRAARPYIGQ